MLTSFAKSIEANNTKRNVVIVNAEVEVDELTASHDPQIFESKLKQKLGEEVLKFATVQTLKNPMDYTVKKKAVASVVEKDGN